MTTIVAAGTRKSAANGASARGTDRAAIRRQVELDGAAQPVDAGISGLLAEITSTDAVGMLAEVFRTMATRLTVMIKAEYEAKEALAATVNMLVAQRTRESTLLNEMSELLQACASVEEGHRLIGRLAGQIFPETAGAVFRI